MSQEVPQSTDLATQIIHKVEEILELSRQADEVYAEFMEWWARFGGGSPAGPWQIDSDVTCTGRITATEDLNIRGGPGLQYNVIDEWSPGDNVHVTVYGKNGDWFLVDAGWIYKNYVVFDDSSCEQNLANIVVGPDLSPVGIPYYDEDTLNEGISPIYRDFTVFRDEEGHIYFRGSFEAVMLQYARLFSNNYTLDHPFSCNPVDPRENPCTSFVNSMFAALGYFASHINLNYVPQSNPGLLDEFLFLNAGLSIYMEPLLPIERVRGGRITRIPVDQQLIIKRGDIVFHVNTQVSSPYTDTQFVPASPWDYEFVHTAMVMGWGPADWPYSHRGEPTLAEWQLWQQQIAQGQFQLFPTYEDAIRAGITDPVPYVADRGGWSDANPINISGNQDYYGEDDPYRIRPFDALDTERFNQVDHYVFWTVTEPPSEGSYSAGIEESDIRVELFNSPDLSDPAGVYIFAWHRYDVIAWSDIGGVTWLQLDNNYWILSDVVLELRFEDNEWHSEPDLTEIQSNLPQIP